MPSTYKLERRKAKNTPTHRSATRSTAPVRMPGTTSNQRPSIGLRRRRPHATVTGASVGVGGTSATPPPRPPLTAWQGVLRTMRVRIPAAAAAEVFVFPRKRSPHRTLRALHCTSLLFHKRPRCPFLTHNQRRLTSTAARPSRLTPTHSRRHASHSQPAARFGVRPPSTVAVVAAANDTSLHTATRPDAVVICYTRRGCVVKPPPNSRPNGDEGDGSL